jgi:hypothetical protein
MTTSLITSGDESNQRNGLGDLAIPKPYPAQVSGHLNFALTMPVGDRPLPQAKTA